MSSSEQRVVIGVVSDTHVPDKLSQIPSRALEILRDSRVEAILHAGDICRPGVLARLEGVARVIAVRGNRDILWPANWPLPHHRVVEFGGVRIGLTHGHGSLLGYLTRKLRFSSSTAPWPLEARLIGMFPTNVQAVVYGHDHIPRIHWRDDTLFFNPGSLAPEYFTELGPTIGLLRIRGNRLQPEIVRVE